VVIWGLEKYRYYLEEHSYKVEIWSDYQNLIFFRTAQKLTRRQARWALFMTYFDFVLYYKPGKTIQVEDLLSRWADHEIGTDLDNTNQVLLKPEFFAINALEVTHEIPINDKVILRKVKAALLSDKVTKDYKTLLLCNWSRVDLAAKSLRVTKRTQWGSCLIVPATYTSTLFALYHK